MDIRTTVTISDEQIRGLLCCAFEGGSGYWCPRIDGYTLAGGLRYKDFQMGGKMQPKDDYWAPSQLIPLVEGCAVLCVEDCGEGDPPVTHRLDRDAIAKGLQVMANEYPRHFANVVDDNADAETGDVFLQCCLLGQIVYG